MSVRACVVAAPRLWRTHVRVVGVAALRKFSCEFNLLHDAPPRALLMHSGKFSARSRCYAHTAVGRSEGVEGESVSW